MLIRDDDGEYNENVALIYVERICRSKRVREREEKKERIRTTTTRKSNDTKKNACNKMQFIEMLNAIGRKVEM